MNPFEMVLGIVLIVMAARVLTVFFQSRQARPAIASDPDAERLRDEVSRLRERVQVLERVVTDQHQSGDLGAEIERLPESVREET